MTELLENGSLDNKIAPQQDHVESDVCLCIDSGAIVFSFGSIRCGDPLELNLLKRL